jgi:dihydrofolate reductase
MEINLIWGQDNNGGIGKNGKLPWHISEDLINFKKITLNSTIIMGRKTWESLPIKPLPHRRNIVLSSKFIKDVENYDSIKKCLKKLKINAIKKIFVIGGAQVYKHFFEYADKLHVTHINEEFNGIDTYFPISMEKITNQFHKEKEFSLGSTATYTQWVKSK